MPTCTLCDLPTPDPPVTDGDVEGAFCCRGCLEAARALGEVDQGEAREALGDAGAPEDAPGETAYLAVEGMHCATCEAFIEGRATDADGVLAASASYPSGLVRLAYDPEVVDRDELPSLLEGAGYRAREADGARTADRTASAGRLLVGGFFGMMAMLWYVLFLYPAYLGVPADALLLDLDGPAGTYLVGYLWAFATVVVGYTGFPILRGAYVSLRAGAPNMDLLIALAALAAYGYSAAVALTGGREVYFDVAVVIVLAVTVGNHYEGKVRERAAGRLADLAEERVAQARRRTADGTETVPVEALEPGDPVVVREGERIPVDGEVLEGTAAVDESLLTGESAPARVEPGDEAIGGACVLDGGLVVAAGGDGESTLDRLLEHLWAVRSARPGTQRLADRLAAVFVPLVLVLAVLAAGWRLLGGAGAGGALLSGLAVLVVSCPCALGLATPLAVAAGVSRALEEGIVVTDAAAFERATEVDVVALDKTGTLTTGGMRLIEAAGEGLERAAAVEQFADHPVADAVTAAADGPDAAVEGFRSHPGRGASATVDSERVVVGTTDLLAEEGLAVPGEFRERAERAREEGLIPALVGWDGRARGVVVAGDEPRPGWESVVEELSDGRRVVVLTGDGAAASAPFREHPAVDEVFTEVPPEGKTAVIERLREDGAVAMVGDGSNDAPALAAADLGIALESGTALAADAADATVTTDDLSVVPAVFGITAATRRRIRGNLGWAFVYNATAIPLAVAGVLNPLFAAVAMAASSLLVVGNSARDVG